MERYHRPVLLREVIEALDVQDGGWYLDCTLGDGGHSLEILKLGGNVVGIDVDPEAIERAKGRLGRLGDIKLIQGNFRDVKNLIEMQADTERLKFAGAKSDLAGAIFDLGVSSMQLEAPERGFSFAKVGPLDMRMDPNLAVRALDLINVLSRKEVYELFKSLGEEKYSWALADALVRARQIEKITTTRQLVEIVERVVGRVDKIHPATRVFQALRIAVNDELSALQDGLNQVIDLIESKGHVVVVSFHSLEDRIVKNTFKMWKSNGLGEALTKKPIVPSSKEVRDNPRSRSAKMRVFRFL